MSSSSSLPPLDLPLPSPLPSALPLQPSPCLLPPLPPPSSPEAVCFLVIDGKRLSEVGEGSVCFSKHPTFPRGSSLESLSFAFEG